MKNNGKAIFGVGVFDGRYHRLLSSGLCEKPCES